MTSRGGGLLVVRVDVRPEDEDELNRWYDTEHVPERLALPGFRSAARYRSAERAGRYLAVYLPDMVRWLADRFAGRPNPDPMTPAGEAAVQTTTCPA